MSFITEYSLVRSLATSHPKAEITTKSFLENLEKIKPEFTNKSVLLRDHIVSTLTEKPYLDKSLDNDEWNNYALLKSIQLTYDFSVEEFLSGLQKENLLSVRRFLYTKGKSSIYYNHSKTRCPLSQMLICMYPTYNIQLGMTQIEIKEKTYEIENEIIWYYVTRFDEYFKIRVKILRDEAIAFMDGFLGELHFGKDYRK